MFTMSEPADGDASRGSRLPSGPGSYPAFHLYGVLLVFAF